LEEDYLDLVLLDGSERAQAAVRRLVPDAQNFGDVYVVLRRMFAQLCDRDPSFARRDSSRNRIAMQEILRKS